MPDSASTFPPRASWQQGGRVLRLEGSWHRDAPAPVIEGSPPAAMPERYEAEGLRGFDSTLPAFLLAHARTAGGAAAGPWQGLPENLRGLMELALSVPEKDDARSGPQKKSGLRELGRRTLQVWQAARDAVEFTGESVLALGRFATGRARFRARDFWEVLQQCGAEALPIVALISFLVGLILGFVGNVQLTNFGANIFVADLVAIAMVREMGVMMTAIIMSGRTGAAFAAHLGSMKANEEIDALRTFGLQPFDFLVLPRLLALVLMMPLLTVYSNVIGILGGMVVGISVGIPPVLYWNETLLSLTMTTASLGVMKSFFFGAAIAICGCMTGMNAGRSSAAVGEATTRAVVASITVVIVLDSAFAAIFTILDI
ncbi:MAG TPA: hypothetical protein DIT64_22155 [Verrucomicrobiales bacterium]|nr:hypothetical protein [Verrucomicrobiales bacterium]HRJ10753.1 ABC transporter permease [Prosthecobacter sp.]HRK13174.1 ABC transporter permease [Prosthecobacter sp.]